MIAYALYAEEFSGRPVPDTEGALAKANELAGKSKVFEKALKLIAARESAYQFLVDHLSHTHEQQETSTEPLLPRSMKPKV